MPTRKMPTYNKPRKVRWGTSGAALAGRTDLPEDLEDIRKQAARYRKLRDRVLRKVRDPAVRDQLLTGGH